MPCLCCLIKCVEFETHMLLPQRTAHCRETSHDTECILRGIHYAHCAGGKHLNGPSLSTLPSQPHFMLAATHETGQGLHKATSMCTTTPVCWPTGWLLCAHVTCAT